MGTQVLYIIVVNSGRVIRNYNAEYWAGMREVWSRRHACGKFDGDAYRCRGSALPD